ncbi:hypothetical protein ACQ4LE_006750 [Meloidogyne hapla]
MSTNIPFIALTIIILLNKYIHASDFLRDCQANEKYIECGGCEGTCKEPVVLQCSKECKPARCECQSKKGFVRAHDGACISASECATYKGAYFGSGGVLLSQSGILMKNAPKTVLNQVRFVSGGAGFSLPSSRTGGNTGGVGGAAGGGGEKVGLGALGERNRLFGDEEEQKTGEIGGGSGALSGGGIGAVSGEAQAVKPHVPSYNTESPLTNQASNNAITSPSNLNTQNIAQQYGDETNLFHSVQLKDQVIPQHRDDIPPVIKGHHKQHLTNKPSHMNLFSDLADTEFGSERLGGEGTNKLSHPVNPTLLKNNFKNNQHKHQFPRSFPDVENQNNSPQNERNNQEVGHSLVPVAAARSITVMNKQGLPDRSKAKCGRKCNPEQLPPTEVQRLARIRHLRTKNQPYLYAYMNPPAEEVAKANAKFKKRDSRSTRRAMGSPLRRMINKKRRMVNLHSEGYEGDSKSLSRAMGSPILRLVKSKRKSLYILEVMMVMSQDSELEWMILQVVLKIKRIFDKQIGEEIRRMSKRC